jgi:undecaprenyl diphosphate synthase
MDHPIRHIAFVPDGNRRWARRRGLSPLLGHKSGYELIKTVTPLLKDYGIRYVTYYMFSVENWRRSEEEVTYLMEIFRNFFSEIADYVREHDIRVVAVGNLEQLPADVADRINRLEDISRDNRSLTMIAAVSYGGRDEIVRAATRIATDFADGKIVLEELDEDKFASYLDTAGLPYPDVLVRTGEKRISNFLIWQTAYSEVFFLDKLWPDFSENDLRSVVSEFSRRERRYGR